MSDNRVQDGPSCLGCGLPNYQGICPHCRGDEQEYNQVLGPYFGYTESYLQALEEAKSE